jgi:hypothetical protein
MKILLIKEIIKNYKNILIARTNSTLAAHKKKMNKQQ